MSTKIVPASEIKLWKVTEDGDCEGRTTRTVGYYKGSVEEIALMLAHKGDPHYALMFTPVSFIDAKDMTPKPNEKVYMRISLYQSNCANFEGVNLKPTFKGTTFKSAILRSNSDDVVLILNQESHMQKLREEALSKLTLTERKILGLA